MHGKPRVLVAMSGGVDSSVAAALLVREGYDVVGCFMRLGTPGESLEAATPHGDACDADRRDLTIRHRGCCSISDAADARLVAAELGIPLYVCNFKQDFGRIIDYFVDEYAAGRTPNPCVRCNDWLKFGKLHAYAQGLGAGFIASGHYARSGGGRLLRGFDQSKDQSYVLFGMPREQLAHTLFPVGGLPKSRTRELAREFGLPVFDKPDSQEICFVPDDDYAGLVERLRPDTAGAGAVVDTSGRRVGEHAGQHRFTIGQRRGLSLSLGHPVYVVRKDAETNTVVVGGTGDLEARACTAGEANWLVDPPAVGAWFACRAKFRYNSPAVPARARVLGRASEPTPSGRQGTFEVAFDAVQRAVSPGQAVVLYEPDAGEGVLGGGWMGAVR